MGVSRKRPKGVRGHASFGLGVLVMGLMPNSIGYQDLASLIARQPDVSQRARAHMMASPFGTIHAATFSFPQPVGTLIPEPPLARVASVAVDPAITGSVKIDSGMPMQLYQPRLEFPSVNRALKGDMLVSRRRDREPGPNRDLTPGKVKTVTFTKPGDAPADLSSASTPAAPAAPPKAELLSNPGSLTPADLTLSPDGGIAPKSEARPQAAAAGLTLALAPPEAKELSGSNPLEATLDDSSAAVRLGRLYFGNNPVGDAVGPIQPWPMDEAMEIVAPPAIDPDIKATAVMPPAADPKAAPQPPAPAPGSAGETVAPKGEVTGPGKRPRTPAERLRLDVKQRAKAEKCLAEAVYFESRGEPKRGQIAVAQVVMNRVFSGFYPSDVCGVVYQNANRKLACQFTFACDGIPDVVREPEMWTQAKEISRDMLDGKLWLPEVGHSTHYHAYWVHPAWVREMRRMQQIGVHSFYRPRAWGDGSEMPPLGPTLAKPQDGEPAKKAKL